MHFDVLEISLDKIVKIRKASKFSTSFLSSNLKNELYQDFPGDPVVKNSPSNAGDMGLIPGHGTNISTYYGATKPVSCDQKPLHHKKRKPMHHSEDPVWSKKKKRATLLTSLTLHPALEFLNSSLLSTTEAPSDLDVLLISAEFGFSMWD